jgi:MFS family permease
LALLAAAELLGMTVWFSASAVVPSLQTEWQLGSSSVAWLTLAVQLGFVAGTFLSALLNLPDVFSTRHIFAHSALAGAASNAAFGLFAHDVSTGVLLRFLTGVCLAGVYPPGMKILATWFRKGRGLALGVLIGALTLGKASPYLINTFGMDSWRQNLLFTSVFAAIGGLIVLFSVREGPYPFPMANFDIKQIGKILKNRGVRWANFGYFGHMWELYAMWTWIPVMIRASLGAQGHAGELAEIAAFLVLGSGAAGCVIAGLAADRIGRTLVTSWAMVLSGGCCLAIGLLFHGHPVVLLVVATIWGATVVADSAQFSTCVTELGDPRYIGTALTLQTCLGFLLTTVSIQAVPLVVEAFGWSYAFMVLAPGPGLGVVAMLRLRGLPEAERIAQGRR